MIHRKTLGFGVVCGLAVLSLFGCTGDGARDGTREGTRKEPAPGAQSASALDLAHRAYLDGDFTAMSEHIRDVLVDRGSSQLVNENAYELLDKAYEAQGGKLPSAQRLVEPFGGRMQYGHIRGMGPNGPFYQAFFRGPIRDASRITSIVVKRLPNEIIFDKKAGKGTFEIKHDTPGFEDFNMDTGRIDALPADGVFTTRVELDDGTFSENWFIAHDLTASSSPEMQSPAPAESFSSPNPIVRWVPYRSAHYAPFESRILSIYVSSMADDGAAWDLWTYNPGELSQVAIGDHPGFDKTKLAAGDYWITLGAAEERVFGPMRLVRVARTGGPFHVVR